MSLRDFNSTDDRIIALQNQPTGNGSGLDSFHTIHPEDVEPSNTPKIVGALAVALMVGVAGVGLYASSGKASHPKPIVTASNLPSPSPVAPVAAPAQQAAMAPDANTTPVATDNNTPAPAPVKTASTARRHVAAGASSDAGAAASARMAADSSQTTAQPQQQAAVIAEPVSPTPSPSDIATNNTQSGAAVPPNATTASDMPAAAPTAPAAPDEAAATPAPAQPAAQ